MVGALGATALTAKVWLTRAAAVNAALPAWSALIVQVPAETKVNAPPVVIVQTPVVAEVNATARPELAVAVSVGVVPNVCGPGLAKVMAWLCSPTPART